MNLQTGVISLIHGSDASTAQVDGDMVSVPPETKVSVNLRFFIEALDFCESDAGGTLMPELRLHKEKPGMHAIWIVGDEKEAVIMPMR